MSARLALLTMAFVFVTGCDMASFAAGSTVKVIARGSPALGRLEDPDTAEAAIPGSIGTMEAVLEVRPDDTTLRALLAKSYASFGFGFMMDRAEAALSNDDEATADHYTHRASIAFKRARDLALGNLTIWEDDGGGAEGHIHAGIESFNRYLTLFDDAEEHVPTLFWAAYSWAQYISANKSDVNALADLPFVNALVDRVLALDPAFMQHAPQALRAGLWASTPEQLGGKPREAKALFDEAIHATERKNLMFLVMEAKFVAVALQDRALYQSLLEEVINAGDLDPDLRLSNLLAKRRAERYLSEIDMLFEPAETAEPSGDGAGTPAQ